MKQKGRMMKTMNNAWEKRGRRGDELMKRRSEDTEGNEKNKLRRERKRKEKLIKDRKIRIKAMRKGREKGKERDMS